MLSKQKKIMDNVLFFICVQLNSMISILFFFVKYYCSEQLLFFYFQVNMYRSYVILGIVPVQNVPLGYPVV
jgi:hypothetical protein